ncbi:hypothetical protein [Silicimonas algicola]|uniref:Uncharacterized protein n=1 Tax=Silicimonas algicola TaxID=1826607 RepID=A0A316GC75_9RHOB|nr:hypothetical protein [Silicimonas algicola]PWK58579.1 hypothetical protein C8D95_101393 [Silicimonas algicola]
MTDIAFTSIRPAESAGNLNLARTIVHAYWWAQSVTRTYARTNDVVRSVSKAEVIV